MANKQQGWTLQEHLDRDRRTNPKGKEKGGDHRVAGESLFRCITPGHEDRKTIGSSVYCLECKTQRDHTGQRSPVSPPIPTHDTYAWSDRDPSDHKSWSNPKVGSGVPLVARGTCDHLGQTPVLTLSSGKLLYAAQGAKLTKVDHLDLIIDCAGYVPIPKPFVASRVRRFQSLNTLAAPDVVRLQWPDMTAPTHVGRRFWERLLAILPQHTCIACIGSHGRTGTALASLLVVDGMDPEKAIVEVRTKHCRRAIETPAQEAYVKALGARR